MTSKLKIALNCDWLTTRGWAEKVILDILKVFPNADIFTSIYYPENFPELELKKVKTSYLQNIPKFLRKHTALLPFYPKAFESFDFSWYDVVISSSHNLSKWIISSTQTLHICYCHTPVRSLWSDHNMYKKDPRYRFIPKFILKNLLHKLRIIDFVHAQRVDHYLSNSEYISKRIEKFYNRHSKVCYPACFIDIPKNYKKVKWEYFLSISRFVPTKNIDILIEVFNKIPWKKLMLLWNWSEYNRLKKMIKWENIEIKKWNWNNISLEEKWNIMSKAIAFLHPQKEDFWITPIEAQSFHVPVIAYNKWGARETVIDWKTWVLFDSQDINSIIEVIQSFDENKYSPEDLENNVKRFSFENFKEWLEGFIARKLIFKI